MVAVLMCIAYLQCFTGWVCGCFGCAAAWNGQPLQGPNTEDMAQLRSRINAKESAADAAAAERCQRMADLAARLDTTLQEQGGSAAKATTDPTCKALEVSNAH
ncbi:hypothetical protein KAM343_44450 [Aeromonas caviae]|uniref:Uncharacterized protein n=2 Tax=Aeromonas caviae TaxID=648 RepID=A0AAV4YSC8_AERCA|nr:hypothetical protein KAM343_44450 [Aeromonas caviae]